MRQLVIGGTGMVGSNVVRELLARGQQVRVLTRDGGKADSLPAGAEAVVGDVADSDSHAKIFEGAEGVFILNPVSQTEVHEGVFSVAGAVEHGAKRLVYMSVQHVDRIPLAPHFAGKTAVEAAVTASGIPWTILQPNNFYQNDVWFKDALLKWGVYPQPIGDVGCSRVDVRDIGEAAAIALTKPGFENKRFVLGGPEALTADQIVATWSRHLGKPINYGGNDLDAWQKQSKSYGMPAWMVYDFKIMYAHFQKHGLIATPAEIDALTSLLGHAPRSFDSYVAESVAAWK